MSQQINLFDPALLRKRELLTALNLAVASGALVALLFAWGAWSRARLGGLEAESAQVRPQAMALQAQKDAMGAQLQAMKPDAKLEADLAAAQAMLELRSKQMGELKKGVSPEAGGFAEYLRGLARQTPNGLWLTGFDIKDSGASMEISGRMTDPALLADYIRRLDAEPAFKGREFASLKVGAGKLDGQPSADGKQAAAAEPSGPPPFYEFTLTPQKRPAATGVPGTPGAAGGQR
ncbi:MAG TPA: PilN domain-containing protein [Rhodocyclaceae bacterium]